MPRWTLVPADKNMLLECGHENNVQDTRPRRRPCKRGRTPASGQPSKVRQAGIASPKKRKGKTGNRSVFQRDYRLVTAAKSCHMLQSAVWLLQQHDRTIAEHRMTTFRHVPSTAFAPVMCRAMIKGPLQRRREFGPGQRQCQEQCCQNFHPTFAEPWQLRSFLRSCVRPQHPQFLMAASAEPLSEVCRHCGCAERCLPVRPG